MDEVAKVTPIGLDPIPAELRLELGLAKDEVIVRDRTEGHLRVRRATILSEGDGDTLPTYFLGRGLTMDETIRLEKEAFAQAIVEEWVQFDRETRHGFGS